MEAIELRSRFKDAIWYDPTIIVQVGGAGGISSWVTLMLTRIGYTCVVYDDDVIESHNIGGQLYRTKDISKNKVDALYDICNEFSDLAIIPIPEKITEDSPTGPIVVCGFDNMKARKDTYYRWKAAYGDGNKNSIFIDGRLLFEQLTVFCITGMDFDNMKIYEQEHLFDDSVVPDEPCSLKQTSHTAAMIASHMVGFLTNHIVNTVNGEGEREVPFMWEYFVPLNHTN